MEISASRTKMPLVQPRKEQDVTSAKEIERRFVIDSANLPKDLEKYLRVNIFQAFVRIKDSREWEKLADEYFPNIQWVRDMGHGIIRVRKKDDAYIMTIKKRVKQSSRLERMEAENNRLTKAQFEMFSKIAGDFSLSKTRYLIPYKGVTIEADIYLGVLRGLVIAEVEFKSMEQSARFKPPSWFGREVTEDPRYSTRTIAEEHRIPRN